VLKPTLHLTDDQVTKLQAPMAVAMQKKIDAVQKLANGAGSPCMTSSRPSARGRREQRAGEGDVDIVSPDQLTAYKAAMESVKKKK